MKRALQAILVRGHESHVAVDRGEKKITIRNGHRNYTEGPVLLGCHYANWATLANITEVRHLILKQATQEELNDDGYENLEHAIEGLKQFYPDIDENSPITIVRWELL